jgi:hypothetical protein
VAGLAESLVHAIRLRVVRAALAQLEAACELRVDRVGESLDVFVREVGRQLVRRELRRVQDLVRPRTADAGERALVAEKGVEPARLTAEDDGELVGADPERLGAEVIQLARRALGREEPDARSLLPGVLGEDELRAAPELEDECGRLRRLLARLQELEPSGRHQMNEKDELAVLGREEESLAASVRARESSSLERGERRVERLERRDVRRACLRDRKRRDRVGELAPPRFHLGKLGHRVSR